MGLLLDNFKCFGLTANFSERLGRRRQLPGPGCQVRRQQQTGLLAGIRGAGNRPLGPDDGPGSMVDHQQLKTPASATPGGEAARRGVWFCARGEIPTLQLIDAVYVRTPFEVASVGNH